MKLFLSLFFLVSVYSSYAQGEANIWYFGQNAGLDFNGGSPVALTNGQLVTDEGCATISNSSGQLLFYTDGTTVYNKNHAVMVNGTGLMGHPSSVQSATIVPKPGSTNLYFIFTTAQESNTNGFRYSVVDMNLDGGNGAVTTDKNILIYTPSGEHLGITKHSNGQDYWIITHGLHNNTFFAHKLTSSGLEADPVVTNIGAIITGGPSDFFEAGSIKISPSGSKLAFTSVMDIAQLFNFNNLTGVLSNEITLITEGGELVGAAFSPDESLLYLSNSFGKIHQFHLNAVDIPGSKVTIHNGNIPGQMQVGPDNKIYVAFNNRTKLGVINNPNVPGTGCNFILDGVDLAGKNSKLGLPSFNQSFFFTPSITVTSNCVDEAATFNFSTSQTVLSATWNFGDGITSNSLNPTHVYANAGTYIVSISVVTPYGTGSNTTQIIIYLKPTLLTSSSSLKQCDDNNDGFSTFNLNEVNELVVASTSGYTFAYFETLTDAQNNTNPITNSTTYINQTVSTDQVFIRVENATGCFRVATVNLIVSTTLIPTTFHRTFTVCDDDLSGSYTDGVALFDFSSVTPEIEALYPAGQLLDITYYKNLADALAEQNAISNISSYSSIDSPHAQNIYIRVDSQLDNECLGLGHHITLIVEPLPIIPSLSYTQCDDDQNGLFGFITSQVEAALLNVQTNVSLAYWDANNNPLPSPLPNPFYTSTQVVKVRSTNTTANACYFESTITFIVDDLPEVFVIPPHLRIACDEEMNPSEQDGLFAFDTSLFQSTLLGNQTGMIVNYFDEEGNSLSSPLPDPFISGTQNITVEVINPLNTICKATAIIPFVVNAIPEIYLIGDELICSNYPLFTKVINAGLLDETTIANYTYQWFLDGMAIAGATNYELTVNTEGIYTVEVGNSNACLSTRTITVTASNIATIENIAINDLSDNNSISIVVSGLGDYVYSLDNLHYQSSGVFTNVASGVYTVYVKDLNGCGITSSLISVLGIPKYFTPNGDGYHDFWNITGVTGQINPDAVIYIFDRYGNLIKQISPLSIGWDGTLNGKALPSSDYWYSIQFSDGRIVKGHFALKR